MKQKRHLHGAGNNILGRWLHFGIALSTILCLVLSLFMNPHAQSLSFGLVAFNLHKFCGINALVLLGIYLLWSFSGYAKKPSELFPWFIPDRWRELGREIRLGLSRYKEWHLIPATIQGSGLLLIITTIFLGLLLAFNDLAGKNLLSPGWLLWTIKAHNLTASFVWIYLAIHLSAFISHLVEREKHYLDMFKLLTPEERRARERRENAP